MVEVGGRGGSEGRLLVEVGGRGGSGGRLLVEVGGRGGRGGSASTAAAAASTFTADAPVG